ncbi:MAG: hypothetical protein QG643_1239, partial [Pseudomonadota bacterium]|nr:hypothetical protein [Pseudomonadota bacterium]
MKFNKKMACSAVFTALCAMNLVANAQTI